MNGKKANVTLNDLANALGVSSGTVSRALSNHPKISEATKNRVKEVALSMGYVYSIQASIQQNFSHKTIGILVPSFTQNKYTQMIESARNTFESNDYQVIVCSSSESAKKEQDTLLLFENLNVQGALIALTSQVKNPEYLNHFVKKKPTVLFHRVSFDMPCKKVMIDHFQAGYRAVQHLLNNGYNKIAHLGGNLNCPLTKQVATGYKTAIRNGGFTANPALEVFSDFLFEDVMKASEIIFSQNERPDAILIDDVRAAQKLISILQTRKIRIPEDVAIIALGDELDYSYYSPSITTIQFPYLKVGEKAARLLLEQLQNKTGTTSNDISVEPFQLSIRNSTLRN